jgi:glycerol-3-phosphate dehydrogenase
VSGSLFDACQTDDARLVLTVRAEGERYGAVPANRAEVVGLLDAGGRAAGVRVRDTETGESLEVRARAVVNATGVWADRLRPDELHGEAELPTIRPSRGTHLLLAHATLPVGDGVIVPAGDGRTVFVLPWLGQTLVGTTDRDHAGGGLEHVRPAEADVGYLPAISGRTSGLC